MAGHSSSSTLPASPSSQGDRELIDELVEAYLDHVSSQQQNGKASSGGSQQPLATCRRQQQRQASCSPMVEELRLAVINLTDEYQRRYSVQLEELRVNWVIDGDSPRSSFKQVLDNIFMDGCNWGRVITIFVFASMFLRQCQQQRWQVGVSPADVHQWSVDYIATEVLPWVKKNGDWMGLVRFYKSGDADGGAGGREDGHMLKRLLTVAGAAALMGLTSFLVNRA